ncbi:MAG: YdcF family protein [Candidatus Uhrbacteria bacterium]|nr:YdcF family protein [Candidatus Uhrbacteria bacterium]
MHTTAVVMLCGPYDEGNHPPTRRIDRAIQIARQSNLLLFIAGDAFNGDEIRRFQDRALAAGVHSVLPAFDSRHCTLADAQAVGRVILEHRFDRLSRLHLVTDWWHMERASTMLERELERILDRKILVIPESVMDGHVPDTTVHDNERQGLADYLSGRYGRRQVIDPFRHRPELSP